MKKRLITLVISLVLLVGITSQLVSAAQPTHYEVGYAKVDINPYNFSTDDPNDLIGIPMAGNGFSEKRLSDPNKLDDNGDGVVDENDGLFAICIAMTDQHDNTMLQFSVDIINASPLIVNPVRQRIVEKYPEISADRIMVNASHTHSGPEFSNSWKSGYEFSEAYVAYVERVISQMVLAADMALADRTPATMYKGKMEANESKAITGPIGDTLNEARPADKQVTVLDGSQFPDRVYNAVRHYLVTANTAQRKTVRKTTSTGTITLSDGSQVGQFAYYSYTKENGLYLPDLTKPAYSYCGGDNFNGVADVGTHTSRVDYVNFSGKVVTEEYYKENAGTKAWWAADVSVVSSVDHVSETDDTLQLLEFRFDAKYNKKPIVIVNWRAHMTLNRSVSADYRANEKLAALGNYTSYYQMSGDWANALRFVLERKGYRPLFLQGAAGNINGSSRIAAESSWLSYAPEATDSNGKVIKGTGEGYYEGVKLADTTYVNNKGNIYGSELAEVVLECLDEHMVQINKNGGDIHTVQVTFHTERQQVSMAAYQAGKYYAEHYNPASPTGLYKYEYIYYVDANGVALVDDYGTPYTDEAGNVLTDEEGNPVTELVPAEKVTEYYMVTSVHHANSVVNKFKASGTAGATLELNAIMIGKEFAMVTAPNELFDRYSDTSDQYDMSDNLWTILDDYSTGSYGEPFIAGYSNGSRSYLPSRATYFLSEDNDKYATGSYETLTSSYAAGNGEEVVRTFDIMLDFLQKDQSQQVQTTEGYCGHCGKEVKWTKLTEDTGDLEISNIRTGHYYLDKDTTLNSKQLMIGAQACLDLRGHTLTVQKGFNVGAGAVLNVLGQGVIQGDDAPEHGGVFYVSEGGTLNLYEAVLRYVGEATTEGPVSNGGIIYVDGLLNMYGGVIEGTTINWAGAAIYGSNQSTMNFYGGKVLSGLAGASGNCVYARGYILFSGDAVVESVRINPQEGGPALEDMIIVSGHYEGTVDFTFSSPKNGLDVGNSANAEIANARMTAGSRVVLISEGELVLGSTKGAAVVYADGSMEYASGLKQAIELCTDTDCRVVLQKRSTQNVTVTKDVVVDLNGCDVIGEIVVAEGATLYAMDHKTADYDITDGEYGKITNITGNVAGVAATEDRDVYVKVTEETGVSFHAIGLNISAMALRPANGGMYYVCDFAADALAAQQVAAYGIAMRLEGAPDEKEMGQFTVLEGTLGTANGTLLKGVMKASNTAANNGRNAAMEVFGRAYVRLTDGSYLFGVVRQRSLQQQVELADAKWVYLSETERTALKEMYALYKQEMAAWNVPNLKAN